MAPDNPHPVRRSGTGVMVGVLAGAALVVLGLIYMAGFTRDDSLAVKGTTAIEKAPTAIEKSAPEAATAGQR